MILQLKNEERKCGTYIKLNFSATKNHEIMTFTRKQIELEIILLK